MNHVPWLAGLSFLVPQLGLAQDTPLANGANQFRITFSGDTPVSDWTSAAKILVNAGVVPLKESPAQQGDTVCSVALRELKFNDHGLTCTKELNDYLAQLNKSWDGKPGSPVYYPDLAVSEGKQTFTFSKDSADAARARAKVAQSRRRLITQSAGGSFESQTYKVLTSDIEIASSAKAGDTLPLLNLYDSRTESFARSVERVGKPAAVGALHSRAPTLSQWWPRNCVPGIQASLPKPPFVTFLGMQKNEACVSMCVDDACPEIVLYDTKVAEHADLLGALGLPVSAAPNPLPPPACSYLEWTDQFHGTHLAGIMVSQPGSSSATGLAPKARLASLDNREHALGDLSDYLEARTARAARSRQIFVVASDFPHEKNELATFSDGQQRLHTPIINNRIVNAKNILWVVSAGQPKQGSPREEIGPKDNRSPMNLGDQENVIVVTACERCLDDDPELAGWANNSGTLVSVAAPGGTAGEDVYSTATKDAYSKNFGTSQSAAFVAGLVAAMYSCNSQLDALSVKRRLEATSTPVIREFSGERDPLIRAGVINARAALRDHRFGWLRTTSNGEVKFTNMSWCVDSIPLQSVTGVQLRDRTLVPSDVRRILKMPASPKHAEGYLFFLSQWGWTNALARMTSPSTDLLRVKYASDSQYVVIHADDIEDLDVSSAAVDAPAKCN
jgi:hypothetical protein